MSEDPKIGQFELNQAAAEMLLRSIQTVHSFLHSEEMSLAISIDHTLDALERFLRAKTEESQARRRNIDIDTELMGREKTSQQMVGRLNTLFQRVERMERHLGQQGPVPTQAPTHAAQQQREPKQKREPRPPRQHTRPPFNAQMAEQLKEVSISTTPLNGVDGHSHVEAVQVTVEEQAQA